MQEIIFRDIEAVELADFVADCRNSRGQSAIEAQDNGKFTLICTVPHAATRTVATGHISGPPPATFPAHTGSGVAPTSIDVHERDADLAKLHPIVRHRVEAIQRALDSEGIPMRVFEAFRAPERQAHLFAQGRTRPGRRVTNAQPWESYHQMGFAADFVRFESGEWNWNDATPQQKAQWDRFHAIARANGLEPLSWERPHVQIADVSLTELRNGEYPEGGDNSWSTNLAAAIERWPGDDAPPMPEGATRPGLPTRDRLLGSSSRPDDVEWHSMFGGDAWRFDDKGVYTRNPDGTEKLWRSTGAPITVQEILAQHGPAIGAASRKHVIRPELIIMVIATETARFRQHGFTGPATFRWEPDYPLGATGDPALDGKETGDYSAGPMQVMSDTARWLTGVAALGHDISKLFPFFKSKPAKAPPKLGLYDPAVCIDVGTAYIRHNVEATGNDPLLVAAAYNAGGLRPSSENHWRIKSHGNHLDRAAEWYGDACFVLNA